jgi:hypothetical protein
LYAACEDDLLEEPEFLRTPSSGYGGRVGFDDWPTRWSSSSGYGNGFAELDAPGGSGNDGFDVVDDEPAGGGYLKRSLGLGLWGLCILKGSMLTVGLSPSSAGLLMNSSSSDRPRLPAMAARLFSSSQVLDGRPRYFAAAQ